MLLKKNSLPGDIDTTVNPLKYTVYGVRSEYSTVDTRDISVQFGVSNLAHNRTNLPTDNELLLESAEVLLTGPEAVSSAVEAGIDIVSEELVITKTSTSESEKSIYEITFSSVGQERVAAYIELRMEAGTWARASPSYITDPSVLPVYMNFEMGPLNTSATVLFSDSAAVHKFILRGPVNDSTGEYVISQDWSGLPDGDPVAFLFVYGKSDGLTVYIRTVVGEEFSMLFDLPNPVVLGTFPSSGYPNNRSGPTDSFKFSFGNIGTTGEVIEFLDWAVFPDFKYAIKADSSSMTVISPEHSGVLGFDAPAYYTPSEGLLPGEFKATLWNEVSDSGFTAPEGALEYRNGNRLHPHSLVIEKEESGGKAYYRDEPTISTSGSSGPRSQEGTSIEAFISAECSQPFGDAVGCGIGFSTGDNLFKALLLNDGATRKIGLLKDASNINSASLGYHLGSDEVDYTKETFVKLVLDTYRNVANLFVGEDSDSPIITISMSSPSLPVPATTDGMFFFGHLESINTKAVFKVHKLQYTSNFYSYEAYDETGVAEDIPDDPGRALKVRWAPASSGTPTAATSNGYHSITTTEGSSFYYAKSLDGTNGPLLVGGASIQLDVKLAIPTYYSTGGERNSINTETGVYVLITYPITGGVEKSIKLCFIDCGLHGKVVAIYNDTVTLDDILAQNAAGRAVSFKHDWTQDTFYRISILPETGVTLHINSTRNDPVITLPWDSTSGPSAPSTAPFGAAIVWGNMEAMRPAISKWKYLRWSVSNGIDIGIKREYDTNPNHLLGGRYISIEEYGA